MEKEYTYYSVDEFGAALAELTQTEIKKLVLFGVRFCRDYSLDCESEDIYQEAVSRFLAGSRKAPKEVKLVKTLYNAMKSVGDSIIKSRAQKIKDATVSFDDEDGISLDKFKPSSAEAEEVLFEHKYQLIIEHFGDDNQVLTMIELIGEGLKAREITDTLFGGDRKEYDTTYKRFMRKRKQLRKETQCI
jgi:DNA-directed RNA polymerase specialized sigma24 family protein